MLISLYKGIRPIQLYFVGQIFDEMNNHKILEKFSQGILSDWQSLIANEKTGQINN